MAAWDNPILFEQPLNEIIRVFLRLEHLFKQIEVTLADDSKLGARMSLHGLIDVLAIIDRPDLKTKLVKELSHYCDSMSRWYDAEAADKSKIDNVIAMLERRIHHFRNIHGKICQALFSNYFLTSARHHLNMPGGGSAQDMPILNFWLQQSPVQRRAELLNWWEHLGDMRDLVDTVLGLIRISGAQQEVVAEQGLYQVAMDVHVSCQMVQVYLPSDTTVFPEISVGKHRVNVRFLQASLEDRPIGSHDTVVFRMAKCVL